MRVVTAAEKAARNPRSAPARVFSKNSGKMRFFPEFSEGNEIVRVFVARTARVLRDGA